ncbi:MAG TPA: zinc-ribbon domain-containing protein, partial [Gammaproteobacteria bacterium]|nr:zinc-ribbon domain-containing protein [Gammaproteobacteria bacterium]
MQCPRCQCDNREGAKFCEECGTRLVLACPHCGHEVGPHAKFCSECGRNLVQTPAAAHLASPLSYTPRHLAERILAEQQALEARGAPDGERKTITALFADIKGSMALLEDLDPEDARHLIDPALTLMIAAVHR